MAHPRSSNSETVNTLFAVLATYLIRKFLLDLKPFSPDSGYFLSIAIPVND